MLRQQALAQLPPLTLTTTGSQIWLWLTTVQRMSPSFWAMAMEVLVARQTLVLPIILPQLAWVILIMMANLISRSVILAIIMFLFCAAMAQEDLERQLTLVQV